MGKSIFARRAAKSFVGYEGADENAFHPDIVIVQREPKDEKERRKAEAGEPYDRRRNITVDQVRALQRKMATRPSRGERRAIIINPADAMESSAANALLKLLEEPAVNNVFLLVSHRSQNLLSTVKSRCRVLRFKGAEDEDLRPWLTDQASDESDVDAAIRHAEGSPGSARLFLDSAIRTRAEAIDSLVNGSATDPARAVEDAFGSRPTTETIAMGLQMARKAIGRAVTAARPERLDTLHRAYAECVRYERELTAYNYDSGLLAARIADLLTGIAAPKQTAHV